MAPNRPFQVQNPLEVMSVIMDVNVLGFTPLHGRDEWDNEKEGLDFVTILK